MAPAFSSLLNRASQMEHLTTPLSSAQSFWLPSCLLFLLAAPHPTVLCLAGAEATKPWGLAWRGLCLGRTNSWRSPTQLGGSCGNTAVNTLGSRFLLSLRLGMQRSILLP